MRMGTLWAAPFDARTLELNGEAVPLIASVTQATRVAGRNSDTGADNSLSPNPAPSSIFPVVCCPPN